MEDICRTCLQKISDDDLQLPFAAQTDYKDKLMFCVPEMDLRAVSVLKLCHYCRTALDSAFQFKSMCQKAEERVSNYYKQHGVVDLVELAKDDWMKSEPVDIVMEDVAIKQEENDFDINDTDMSRGIKEEVDVDSSQEISGSDDENSKSIEILNCLKCDFQTNKLLYLNNHSAEHSFKEPFRCLKCEFKAPSYEALLSHMVTHPIRKLFRYSNGKLFKCSKCKYRSNQRSDLNNHNVQSHAV